jgi:membrane protease YdiL (CAAX protease family)
MSLTKIAAQRPVLTAVLCAVAQFLITMLILMAGKTLAPPEAFGKIKLIAFASTVILPLLLAHAFGLWKQVGFELGKIKPAPIFLVSLLFAVMYLSIGVHQREHSAIGSDVLIQFINAFGEELLFRGVIFAILLCLPAWQAIVLNGLLFGSMHLIHGYMDASWSAALFQAGMTAMGGMMFAAVRYRTGSLWLVIILHMIKNLSVMYSNVENAAGPGAVAIVQCLTIALEVAVVAWVIAKETRRPALA